MAFMVSRRAQVAGLLLLTLAMSGPPASCGRALLRKTPVLHTPATIVVPEPEGADRAPILFTLALTAPAEADMSFALTIVPHPSSQNGLDYVASNAVATIARGAKTTSVVLGEVLADSVTEAQEQFKVAISRTGAGPIVNIPTPEVTIKIQDRTLVASFADAEVDEGSSMTLAIQLVEPPATDVTFTCTPVGSSTATRDIDYTLEPATGVVVVPRGQVTSQELVLAALNDADVEGTETVQLRCTAVGATTAQAVISIRDVLGS